MSYDRVAVLCEARRGGVGHQVDVGVARAFPDARLAALDPGAPGRETLEQRHPDATLFARLPELIGEFAPQLVAICTRDPRRHLEWGTACLRAGADLYVEKPFADSLADTSVLVRLAEVEGRQLAHALPLRFEGRGRWLVDEIGGGAFGELIELSAITKCDARAGAEELRVLGPHFTDAFAALAGPMRSVEARFRSEPSVEDGGDGLGPSERADTTARYWLGADVPATLHSWDLREQDRAQHPYYVEAVFSDATIRARAPYANGDVLFRPNGPRWGSITDWRRLDLPTTDSYADHHVAALRALGEGDPRGYCTAREGFEAQLLVEAALLAARTGRALPRADALAELAPGFVDHEGEVA